MSVKLQLQNKVMNGAFDFWQRGTSSGLLSANGVSTYTADRFLFNKSSTSNWQVSRLADVPSSSTSTYCLYVENQTAAPSLGASDYAVVEQRIEGNVLRSFKSKKMALSFWVKSNKIGTYAVGFKNSAINRSLSKAYTINAVNTWEKKVIRFTHDASGSWLYDESVGMRIQFSLMFGSNFHATPDVWVAGNLGGVAGGVNFAAEVGNDFYLTDVCLVEDNEGQTRVPDFMYAGRDYFEELQLCQRYFEKSYNLTDAPGAVTTVGAILNTTHSVSGNKNANVYFRVMKRTASPVVTVYDRATGTSGNAQLVTNGGGGGGALNVSGGIAPYQQNFFINYTTAEPTIGFQWTADSEL